MVMVQLLYAIAIVGIGSALTYGFCGEMYQPAATLCQVNSAESVATVYLDTAGIPVSQTALCMCVLEVNPVGGGSPNVIVTPHRDDPGDITLSVDGVRVSMVKYTETILTYRPRMLIRFEKNTDDRNKIQCFEFKLSSFVRSVSIQCMPLLQTTFPASSLTTKETTRLTTHITPPVSTRPLSSAVTDIATTSQDIGSVELKNDSPSNPVAVYVVVPTVAILLVAFLVGVILWRLSKTSSGGSTELSHKVNTVNLDESTIPNADCDRPYENCSSNVQNYSMLDFQLEHATNEHTYSDLGLERDLINTVSARSAPENEHESNRHVCGYDYTSLEPQREQVTKEHEYSGLEPQRDFANIDYENKDSVYENQ